MFIFFIFSKETEVNRDSIFCSRSHIVIDEAFTITHIANSKVHLFFFTSFFLIPHLMHAYYGLSIVIVTKWKMPHEKGTVPAKS